jgi:outer membrane protein assembly factor BamE (lipoprotein component of BamABCDE complex)
MVKIGRALRMGLAGPALALGLVACAATFDNHGYVPPPEELAAVDVGDSRESVAETVGTPGAAGVMRDEAWLYTAYRMRNYAYRAPEVVERDIIAISFDGRGRVSNIEEFGLEDGQIIQLSRRVTTSSVREVSFLRQILSNFGRINVADALAD